jgi:hypothetical protein
MTPEDLVLGKRVEVPVHSDTWMTGDRYGEVVCFVDGHLYVKLDKSGRTRHFREPECRYV